MITLRLRIVFLSSLFLLAAANAFAQTSAEPTRLAVQIRYYAAQGPAYIVVEPTEKHWIWFGRFSRVAGWTEPPNSPHITAVKVNAQQAEEGVRVWVSVLSGKVLENEKQISSYLLREGDTTSAKELTDVGVVPFEFKVMRLAASASYVPEFKSKSPAIELASIQPNFAALPKVQLVLRNVSSKPVYAIEVITVSEGIACGFTMRQGEEGQALIPPGGTFEMSASLKTKSVAGANEYSIQTPPNQLIEVATAVFGDKSYEGESDYAMTSLGYQMGRKAQLERVLGLLENAADVTSLKDKVSALNVDADSSAVDELARQFPQPHVVSQNPPTAGNYRAVVVKPTGTGVQQARTAIEVGMRAMRDDVLKDVSQFEIHKRYADANAFSSWLTSSQQRYKAWLSRL
jgi:hypothetical protein